MSLICVHYEYSVGYVQKKILSYIHFCIQVLLAAPFAPSTTAQAWAGARALTVVWAATARIRGASIRGAHLGHHVAEGSHWLAHATYHHVHILHTFHIADALVDIVVVVWATTFFEMIVLVPELFPKLRVLSSWNAKDGTVLVVFMVHKYVLLGVHWSDLGLGLGRLAACRQQLALVGLGAGQPAALVDAAVAADLFELVG